MIEGTIETNSPLSSYSHIINPENEVNFLEYSECYCICFVDMIDSTKIAASIYRPSELRKYYSIFLNSIARIAKDFGAHVIKNAGDGIIMYFPDTADSTNSTAFKQAIDCCIEMEKANGVINSIMHFENLPPVSYRISADYGRVEIIRSKNSIENDMIGSTMNICSKINSKAKPNSTVIGSDLYEVLKRISGNSYRFEQIGQYSLGLKFPYLVYSVADDNIDKSIVAQALKSARQGKAEKNDTAHPTWSESLEKYKIMIIDDEPDVLATYQHMLDRTGIFEVDAFPSSREALKQFFSMGGGYYNLVITDIRMPPPNGLQLYNLVKSVNKNVKVLFITAHDIVEEVLSMMPDVRKNEIIKKPIIQDSFVRQVKAALA